MVSLNRDSPGLFSLCVKVFVNIPGNVKDGNDLTRGKTEVTFVIGGGVSEALLDLKLQRGKWVAFLWGA